MSKLKITAPGLYSMVFGLLLTLSLGCGRKEVDDCTKQVKKEDCENSKQKGGKDCVYDAKTGCTQEGKATLLQQEGVTGECAKMTDKPEECKDSKNCMFDADKKVCNDAATKNLCANIQNPGTCDKDKSCDGWDKDKKVCKDKQNNDPKKQSKTETKTMKVFSVYKVKAPQMADAEVNKVIVSGNKEWAYFGSNAMASLTTFNMGKPEEMAANMKTAGKWNTKANLQTGLADNAVGLANLANCNVMLRMQPTLKGAVITMSDALAAGDYGAAYLEGADYKAAWKNDAAAARDVVDIGGNAVATRYFGVVMTKKSGQQHMAMFATAGAGNFTGMTNGLDLNTVADPKAVLNLAITRNVTAFQSIPFSVPGYLVDVNGVVAVEDAQVGVAHAFANLIPGTADLGSNEWQIKKGAAGNNNISSVVMAGGLLYIGLTHNNDNKGGVVVFNPNGTFGKKTTKPDPMWNNVNVMHLTVDSNDCAWAVTPNALIKLKPDTTADKKIDKALMTKDQVPDDFDKATDGAECFDGMIKEFDDLTSAEWVGNNLIVTTANEGAYILTQKEEKKTKITP